MRKRLKLIIIILILVCLYAYANKKEVENGYFPSSERTDQEQIDEMCTFHSNKGDITEENGFIIIKK